MITYCGRKHGGPFFPWMEFRHPETGRLLLCYDKPGGDLHPIPRPYDRNGPPDVEPALNFSTPAHAIYNLEQNVERIGLGSMVDPPDPEAIVAAGNGVTTELAPDLARSIGADLIVAANRAVRRLDWPPSQTWLVTVDHATTAEAFLPHLTEVAGLFLSVTASCSLWRTVISAGVPYVPIAPIDDQLYTRTGTRIDAVVPDVTLRSIHVGGSVGTLLQLIGESRRHTYLHRSGVDVVLGRDRRFQSLERLGLCGVDGLVRREDYDDEDEDRYRHHYAEYLSLAYEIVGLAAYLSTGSGIQVAGRWAPDSPGRAAFGGLGAMLMLTQRAETDATGDVAQVESSGPPSDAGVSERNEPSS